MAGKGRASVEHAAMDSEPRAQSDEALLQAVMARQVKLSLQVAAVFVAVLLGLPLVNAYVPALAQRNLGGFSLTWLVLGVLFYPLTWLLSKWFIDSSNRIEADLSAEHGVER